MALDRTWENHSRYRGSMVILLARIEVVLKKAKRNSSLRNHRAYISGRNVPQEMRQENAGDTEESKRLTGLHRKWLALVS